MPPAAGAVRPGQRNPGDAAADLRPIAVEARRRGLITERELSAMKERKDARKIVAALLP
jgi:hypothetical protein